jgi:hypothetical protein
MTRCQAISEVADTHPQRTPEQRRAEGWQCARAAKHWLLGRALCTIHCNAILSGTYVRFIDKLATHQQGAA